MSQLLSVTDETFDREVTRSSIPVVVDFAAESCPPCRALSPLLEKLAVQWAGRIQFVTVDVGVQTRLAARFEVFAIPTLMLFERGEVVDILSGAVSEVRLRIWLKTYLEEVSS